MTNPITTPRLIGSLCAAAIFCLLLYWYSWSATALTKPEVDAYMAKMDAQPVVFMNGERRDEMRRFLDGDDGQPF